MRRETQGRRKRKSVHKQGERKCSWREKRETKMFGLCREAFLREGKPSSFGKFRAEGLPCYR